MFRHCLTRERSLGVEPQAYSKAFDLRVEGGENVAYAMADTERSPKSSWKAARTRRLVAVIFGWQRAASARAKSQDESLKPRLKCKRGTLDFILTNEILGAQRSALKTSAWVLETWLSKDSSGNESHPFLLCIEGAHQSHEGRSEPKPG